MDQFHNSSLANKLNGILFVALFAMAAMRISSMPVVEELKISPLIIGIIIGIFYANTLRNNLPKEWTPGILFSAQKILRAAIIFYGFRVSFQEIAAVGVAGLVVSIIMLASTFLLGTWVAIRFFKLDRDTAILTASGSSVCGAAAVLATEPILKSEAYKGAVAVSTVVLFGTIAMFVYPLLYNTGIVDLSPEAFGIYAGGTIHEVAQVAAVGSAVEGAGNTAVIVKMVRVMLLAPMLILLGIYISRSRTNTADSNKVKLIIPWFAVWFIIVAGFNSLNLLPENVVNVIINIDTFMLTMAMTALGMETNFQKFKEVGIKPFYVAFIMFAWLLIGGYFVTMWTINLF
jgi:uncharacterized integral membrane protein (TIGR00698 family)